MAESEMMEEIIVVLGSLDITERFGRILGEAALSGDLLCLDGELGAGKTTLTQAIARGLGVPEECYVTSPSFAVLQEYSGRIPLYHMDFYRLRGSGDVIDLGFEEFFYGFGLTVIEWADRAADILPENRLCLRIAGQGEGRRTVTITGSNEYWQRILPKVRELQS